MAAGDGRVVEGWLLLIRGQLCLRIRQNLLHPFQRCKAIVATPRLGRLRYRHPGRGQQLGRQFSGCQRSEVAASSKPSSAGSSEFSTGFIEFIGVFRDILETSCVLLCPCRGSFTEVLADGSCSHHIRITSSSRCSIFSSHGALLHLYFMGSHRRRGLGEGLWEGSRDVDWERGCGMRAGRWTGGGAVDSLL